MFRGENQIMCATHQRPIDQCRHRALDGSVDEQATVLTQAHRLRVGHLRQFVVPEEIATHSEPIRGVDPEPQVRALRDRRALVAQRLALPEGER